MEAPAPRWATEGRIWSVTQCLPFAGDRRVEAAEVIRLSRITATIEGMVRHPLDADDLHALALVDLWSGRSAAAVDRLRQATRMSPQSGALRNDLAVVLLARAIEQNTPFDLVRALDSAQAAAELAPDRAEVIFNLALLMEKLGLADGALEQWRRFLSLEVDAGCRSQAAARLATMRSGTYADTWGTAKQAIEAGLRRGESTALQEGVREHLQPIRQWGEEVLLAKWANARLRGDDRDARITLRMAQQIGKAVQRQSGDSMLYDATGVVARAQEANDTAALRRLAQGHVAFAAGLAAYRTHDISAADAALSRAEADLAAAGSPFSRWAAFFKAACLYHLSRYSESAAAFARIRALSAGSSYLALRGRLDWSEGLLHYLNGFPTAAQDDYQHGFEIFAAAGEQENTAVLAALRSEIYYDYFGLTEQAWTVLSPALAALSRCIDPRSREHVLLDAAISSADAGLPRPAATFLSAAIRSATDPVEETTIRLRRADYEVRAGREDLAAADWSRVHALLRQIPDSEVRSVVEADLRLAEGTASARARPNDARTALSEAIRLYTSTHGQLGLLAALVERGELLRRLGERTAARNDLKHAVENLEHMQRQDPTGRLSRDFLDHRYRLVESLVALELDDNNELAALAWADRFRRIVPHPDTALASLDSQSGNNSIARLKALVSPGSLVLYFVLLPERLVAWSITADAVRRHDTEVTRDQVISRIDQLSTGASPAELSSMFELLLRPFARELAVASSVAVVPDRELALVPFAALRDATTGDYLVQHHEIQVSLSLLATPNAGPATGRRTLAIGNPTLDDAVSAQLPSLPESGKEAMEVAALYPTADLLVGAEATPSRFLALAPEADVLHVSTHSVPGGRSAAGRLLLATDPLRAASGVLSTEDLAAVSLPKHPLVFLSVCHGAAGPVSPSGGPSSLAKAFLAAGASGVVASLWAIDDRAAQTLAIEFHRRLLREGSPPAVLREAQLSMMRSPSQESGDPRNWGAFVLVTPSVRTGEEGGLDDSPHFSDGLGRIGPRGQPAHCGAAGCSPLARSAFRMG